MSHLLPPAGVRSRKEEAFTFYKTRKSSNFFKPSSEEHIPPNIHDYRWTDYKEIDRICVAKAEVVEADRLSKRQGSVRNSRSAFNPAGPCPATLQEQFRVSPCPCPQYRGVGSQGGKYCSCMTDGGHGEGYSSSRGSSFGYHDNGNAYPNMGADGDGYGAAPTGLYCPPVGIDPRCLIKPRNKADHNSRRPTGEPYFAQETKKSCVKSHEVQQLRKGGFNFDDWLRTEKQREPPEALRGRCIPTLGTWCVNTTTLCDPLSYEMVQFQR